MCFASGLRRGLDSARRLFSSPSQLVPLGSPIPWSPWLLCLCRVHCLGPNVSSDNSGSALCPYESMPCSGRLKRSSYFESVSLPPWSVSLLSRGARPFVGELKNPEAVFWLFQRRKRQPRKAAIPTLPKPPSHHQMRVWRNLQISAKAKRFDTKKEKKMQPKKIPKRSKLQPPIQLIELFRQANKTAPLVAGQKKCSTKSEVVCCPVSKGHCNQYREEPESNQYASRDVGIWFHLIATR